MGRHVCAKFWKHVGYGLRCLQDALRSWTMLPRPASRPDLNFTWLKADIPSALFKRVGAALRWQTISIKDRIPKRGDVRLSLARKLDDTKTDGGRDMQKGWSVATTVKDHIFVVTYHTPEVWYGIIWYTIV